MPDLDFGVAMSLAGSLTNVGHSWKEEAIRYTAMKLIEWCKGEVINGRVWKPDQQAQALIDHVHEQWDEWPQGATKRLREAFDRLFPHKQQAAPPPDIAAMVARGLLPKPCVHCNPEEVFCEHNGEKGHAAFLEDQKYWADRNAQQPEKPRPFAPVIQLTAEEFQRRAAAFYRDEQQRKAHQVAEVERDRANAERRRDAS